MIDQFLLVLCTCPGNAMAATVATTLIEQNLAACVNRVQGIRSYFRWEGRLEQEDEVLLLIKTTQARFAALEAAIRSVHPHQVPEIIAVPITAGSEAYLQWVSNATAS